MISWSWFVVFVNDLIFVTCTQESGRLFSDIADVINDDVIDDEASERKMKLLRLLLECDVIEKIQKMWRRHVSCQSLQQNYNNNNNRLQHVLASLEVRLYIVISSLCPSLCLLLCYRRSIYYSECNSSMSFVSLSTSCCWWWWWTADRLSMFSCWLLVYLLTYCSSVERR